MSDIVEAVAKAIYEEDDVWSAAFPWPNMPSSDQSADNYRRIARAAIEAYEKATAEQEMHHQRVIWEAVERMKINPPDTPLMDAMMAGSATQKERLRAGNKWMNDALKRIAEKKP